MTSHSAQGATADKVIVHAESGQSANLVNERFAYVPGSRMREGLDVYTDNSQQLTSSLERQFDKTAAVYDRALALGRSSRRTAIRKVLFRPARRPSKVNQCTRLRQGKTWGRVDDRRR